MAKAEDVEWDLVLDKQSPERKRWRKMARAMRKKAKEESEARRALSRAH